MLPAHYRRKCAGDCQALAEAEASRARQGDLQLMNGADLKVTSLTDESVYALAEKHPTLERIHLSYCENITVKSITYAVNRLRNLTHLSLTGVPAFTQFKELQKFCRPPPSVRVSEQEVALMIRTSTRTRSTPSVCSQVKEFVPFENTSSTWSP